MLTTTRRMTSELAHPSDSMPATLMLRLLAIAGVVAAFFDHQASFASRPAGEWFYTLLTVAFGVCMLFVLTPRASKLLLRHKDLLVPCGCYLLANECSSLLPNTYLGSLFSQFTLNPGIILPALMMLAVALAITATFAVWQTLIIMQAVTSDGVDLLGELRHTLTLLPRGMGIIAVAYVALHGPLLLSLWFGLPSVPFVFPVFLVGWAIYAVVGGVVTCLWLPLALDVETPFWDSLRAASRASLSSWRANAVLIGAWAVASGVATLRYVSTSSYGNHSTTTSWMVQPEWYGEYVFDSAWYTKAAIDEAQPLIWLSLPIAVLFTCVSLAVKATLIQRLDDQHPDNEHPDNELTRDET